MASKEHRLRKYARRKAAARDNGPKFNALCRFYWRYHHQVYGPTVNLWDIS